MTLSQIEIQHELGLMRRGANQLRQQIDDKIGKGYFSSTKSGRYVFHRYVERFAACLEEITDQARQGLIVRTNISAMCQEIHEYIHYFEHGCLYLSSVVLKAILDSYSRSDVMAEVQQIAGGIGRRIEDEIWFEFDQRRLDPDDAARMRQEASMPGSNPHYRKRGAKQVAKKAALKKGLIPLPGWTSTHRVRVGLYMLEVSRSAEITSWETVIRYGKNQTVVYSDEFMNEVFGYEELAMARTFHSYPLIDAPLDWDGDVEPSRRNTSGGYHLSQLRRHQQMCRSYQSDSVFGEKSIHLLNTLQKTAWRVDSRILKVAEHLEERRIAVKSFRVSVIDRPVKGNAPPHVVNDSSRLDRWKAEQHRLHCLYQEQTKKAYATRQVLSMAKEFEFKTYYLSWSLDWRGRFYPQQSWLTPQSTDFEKSLMKFSDGCKLTPDSLDWCKSAIGAAFNGTRISFQERIQWTENNSALLKSIAEDPLSTITQWEAAKEPWQFLQLCLEWNDVVVTEKEPFWKVPIGADSTASGLQLLSAMRRDPVGMKYANLLEPESPSAPPQDAYMRVLEVAKVIASKDPELKHLRPYLGHRSIGKPAVMLSVYGGSHQNIKADIEAAVDEIKDELEAQGVKVDRKDMSKLTTLIINASQQVFPAAYEALRWLKRLAKQAHKDGRESLTWTTPSNDSIHLIKTQIDTIKIYTAFNGTVSIGDLNEDKPDLTKQVSSFPPSFVHCYDAALLKEAFSDWTHPIALIHDCIRVLPTEMDQAMDRVRHGFASIVAGDPLARLADDLCVPNANLKRLPQLSQDLSCIQHSKYMFN